jgi:hypothetical protein
MTDVPNVRSFSLNIREAYGALMPPPDPHGWGPKLFRDARYERREEPVCVWAEERPVQRRRFRIRSGGLRRGASGEPEARG